MKQIISKKNVQCKPEIEYPCQWQYKVIGTDRDTLVQLIEDLVTPEPYSLEDSNTSSSGRYISLNLEITVASDQERLHLYESLAAHVAVKVVL